MEYLFAALGRPQMYLIMLRSDALARMGNLVLTVSRVTLLTQDHMVLDETVHIQVAIMPIRGQVDLLMLEDALNDLTELLRILNIADEHILTAMAGLRSLIKSYYTIPVALLSERVAAGNCPHYIESVPS